MAYWDTDQILVDGDAADLSEVWMSDGEANDAVLRERTRTGDRGSGFEDYSLFDTDGQGVQSIHKEVPIRFKDGTILSILDDGMIDLKRSSPTNTSTTRNSGLCSRCSSIDFKTIFDIDIRTIPPSGVRFARMEVVDSELRKSTCQMCVLIVSMIDRGHGGKTIRTMGGKVYDRINHDLPDNHLSKASDGLSDSSGTSYFLKAFPGASFKHLYNEMGMDESSIVVGLEDSNDWLVPGSPYPYDRGMLVWKAESHNPTRTPSDMWGYVPHRVYQKVASIIGECTTDHSTCSAGLMSFPDGARVIECSTSKIVLLTKDMQYLALSYVWGIGRSPPNVDEGDTLPKPLPKTIEDAIHICNKLGFKYLWIDRYCIKQYHSSDKMKQIGQMGNIYSHATATICAIGKDDEAAIMGVSTPRSTSNHAKVNGGTLFLYGHDVSLDLRRSVWKQRAWTLQEVMLARLCLFFTDAGVMITCRENTYMENSASRDSFRVPRSLEREVLMFGRAQDHVTGPASQILRFELLQAEYLKRQLGYDSDGLNAFRGLLSQMETPSYWGITTLWVDETPTQTVTTGIKFLESLFWIAGSAGKKRDWKEAPSWSWVSRTNQLRNRDYRNMSFGGDVLFEADLYVVLKDGAEVQLEQFFDNSVRTGAIAEQSKFLRVHSIMADWSKRKFGRGKLGVDIAVEEPWLRQFVSGIEGSIVFDEGDVYDDNKENEVSWLGWTDFEDGKYPERGQAVLLTIKTWEKYWVLSRWLSVVKLADGMYERQGTITLMWPIYLHGGAIDLPLNMRRETILLG